MIENVLKSRGLTFRKRIAVKTIISALLAFSAVMLPQLVHIALGQSGGAMLMPMYLPVLIGGCLLGTNWGVAVGMTSPLISFVLTLAVGTPMPTAERLPFMMAELAVFAVVSGLFADRISKNGLWSVPAVVLAQLCGRGVFMGLAFAVQNYSAISPQMVWSQIQTGFAGLALQIVAVPVIIMALRKMLIKENGND